MGRILGGVPAWVYVLLVALIVLGVRRLRTREVPVAVALIPAVAFSLWSVIGASAYAAMAGAPVAALTWLGGAVAGAASAFVAPEPRGMRLANGRVRLPGSLNPLTLYIIVFVARFSCGAWAAIDPTQARLATGVGIAVGAVMTARLVTAIVRWQKGVGTSDLQSTTR